MSYKTSNIHQIYEQQQPPPFKIRTGDAGVIVGVDAIVCSL